MNYSDTMFYITFVYTALNFLIYNKAIRHVLAVDMKLIATIASILVEKSL